MIDPKRLTEKDRGREVILRSNFGVKYEMKITSWSDRFIFTRYPRSEIEGATNPRDLDFASGTYQDGGAE